MALTISAPSERFDVWGRFKVQIVTVTFDADLDEAGEAFTAANLGWSEIYAVIPAGPAFDSGTETTFDVKWRDGVLYGIVSITDFAGDDLDASTYTAELLVIGI